MHLIKMENSSKDRKQRQASQQAAFDAIPDQQLEVKEQENQIVWDFTDRRSGEDRRIRAIDRGRWFESRTKQDRRKTPCLYMQI